MKKILIAAILFCGFAEVAAQGKGDVEFGVNTGLNISTVRDNRAEAENTYGFNLGLGADYFFSESWSIKAKLVYDQKGWNNGIITDENGMSFVTDYDLNYLTVPVMANWHFGRTKNWYLNFGAYTAFLMSANESRFDMDVKDAFNSSDFGLALGIGVKVPVSDKLKLFFEYEEMAGIRDVLKENPYSAIRNDRAAINIGLNFILK